MNEEILFDSTLEESVLKEIRQTHLVKHFGRIWSVSMNNDTLYLGIDMGEEGTSTLLYIRDRIGEVLKVFEVENHDGLIGKEVTAYLDPTRPLGRTLGIYKKSERKWTIPQGYVHLG